MTKLKTELKLIEIAVKNKMTLSKYLDYRAVLSKLGYVKQINRKIILED